MRRLSVNDFKKETKKKSRTNDIITETEDESKDENEAVSMPSSYKLTIQQNLEFKILEALLSEPNLHDNYEDISFRLSYLNANILFNYQSDETQDTFLHQLVNRPKAATSEALLLRLFGKFVEQGCNLNAVDEYGWSCLHYCCVNAYGEIANFILEHVNFNKALINCKSKKQLKTDSFYFLIGTTPLQVCTWLNNTFLAKTLIRHNASILDKNAAGWTCLHICARQAYLDLLNYFIRKELNVNIGNNHKKTPLHVASRHGHVDIAEALIKAKANLTLTNNYGQSALFVAVSHKHVGIAKLLIENGAAINQADLQLSTPLHACAQLKESKTDEVPIKINRNLISVQLGELLLSNGGDATRKNYLGRNPLHYCAKNNLPNLALLLINKSFSLLNSRDLYGETPLFIACKTKSIETIKILLNCKANKDIADLTGKTPIHLFAEETDDSSSFVSILLQYGDDVNKATIGNDSLTPLHIASKNNNTDFVQLLLQNGADVNKTNQEGATSLHVASEEGAYETCVLLLDNGAKITKVNKDGHTPLHSSIFARFNSKRIASLLIDYGSSINQEDNEKITPIALATLLGNYEIVQLLTEKKASILNSEQESVAHIAAIKNQCDTKCIQLLISNYGFSKLFKESQTNSQTPLQSCVLNKSQNFLQSLIACDNITCLNWFKSLHSIRGYGVSPIIMAATSQNYEFIRDLISMWFRLFHDDHHNMNFKREDYVRSSNHLSGIMKRIKLCFDKNHKFERKKEEIYIIDKINQSLHGCSTCKNDNYCLFKPNWNDKEQEYGKYFLNVLIRENPQLTVEILNTFLKTDILKWQIYVFLDHLEPCEDILNSNLSKYERPLTPLETIFFENQLLLVSHPVVKALIKEKLKNFGKFSLILDTLRQICLLAVWTAFVCCEDYSVRHCYSLDNKIGKIILIIFCGIFFLWDLIEECVQIYYTYQRVTGYRTWLFNSKLKTSSFLLRSDASLKNELLEKQRNDFLLIDKDIRALENMKSPYQRIDNLIDWLAIIFQMATLISHFIDISHHTDQKARIHLIIATLNCIGIWLRQLLIVNGLIPSASLVCMLRLMGMHIVRFGFLYIRIYIPFCLLFWTLFSGAKIAEESMKRNYKECEYLTYGVPYEGSYSTNISLYSNSLNNPYNCSSIQVSGFEDFYNSLYSVFRFIVVDDYDFDSMKQIHNILAPIICAIFLILSAIIGLNFFVGLITSILSDGAYTAVESHKLMELLGYVLQQEWRLSKAKRQKHLDLIKTQCSPKIIQDNKEVIETIHTTTAQNTSQPSIMIPSDIESKILDLEYKIEKNLFTKKPQTRSIINNNQQSNNGQIEKQHKRQHVSNEDSQLINVKNEIKEMKASLNEIRNILLKNSKK